MLSCIQLFATSWTAARQAPLSMGFSRQEYWSGLPFPTQGSFQTQGSNPHLSPVSPALAGRFLTTAPPTRMCAHTHTHTHTHNVSQVFFFNQLLFPICWNFAYDYYLVNCFSHGWVFVNDYNLFTAKLDLNEYIFNID